MLPPPHRVLLWVPDKWKTAPDDVIIEFQAEKLEKCAPEK